MKNNKQLSRIAKLVAKHKKEIAPLQDKDEPAIARPNTENPSIISNKAKRKFKVIDEEIPKIIKGKVNSPDQAEFDADGRPILTKKSKKKDGDILIDPDEREIGDVNVVATQEDMLDKYKDFVKRSIKKPKTNKKDVNINTNNNNNIKD